MNTAKSIDDSMFLTSRLHVQRNMAHDLFGCATAYFISQDSGLAQRPDSMIVGISHPWTGDFDVLTLGRWRLLRSKVEAMGQRQAKRKYDEAYVKHAADHWASKQERTDMSTFCNVYESVWDKKAKQATVFEATGKGRDCVASNVTVFI